MLKMADRCNRELVAGVVLAVLVLAGCGGNHSAPEIAPATGTADTGVEEAVAVDAGLPPGIPLDEYVDPAEIIARRGSVWGEFTIPGNSYLSASAGAVTGPEGLELVPDGMETAWAMYGFAENLSSDAPWVFGLELADYTTQGIHLCVTDYQGEAWCWVDMGRAGPVNYCGVPGDIDPLSPGGYIYTVVVVEPGCRATISGVTLYRESESPPPVGLETGIGGTHPDRIDLAWEDPAETYPGLEYEGIAVERQYQEEEWSEIARLNPGVATYEDIDGEGNDYPFGVECRYRLRTVVGGEMGVAGPEAVGTRALASVVHLGAARCVHPDYTRLDWDPVPGAGGYVLEIFYDDAWQVLAEIASGDTTEYLHYRSGVAGLETALGVEYEYRIRATWEDARSPEYAQATGSRGLGRVLDYSASKGYYPDEVELYFYGAKYSTSCKIGYSVDGGEIQVLATYPETCDYQYFYHTYQSPPGMESEMEVEYTYYFNPEYNGEIMPWDTVATDTGYRSIRTPYDLSASDGESGEFVHLSWHPQINSDGIRIYRDGTESEHLVADLGYCWQWDDYVGDLEEHTYYVQSGWQDHWSDLSEPDTGYRNLILLHEISEFSRINSLALTELDGTPAIALSDYYGVRFYHAGTPEPTSLEEWAYHTVDGAATGTRVSMAVQDGRPLLAIAGNYDTGNALNYRRALVTSPQRASDWATHQISGSDEGCSNVNLTVLDGNPAVSFWNSTNRFARAVTAQPADGGDWVIMDLPTDGTYPTLTGFADRPVFACFEREASTYDLRLLIGTSAAPETAEDWVSYILDSASPYCSFGEIDGRLALCYQNDETDYYYCRAGVEIPGGPDDWQVSRLGECRGLSGIGRGVILEHNGYPVVCFCDCNQLKLAVAQIPEPAGDGDWIIYNLGEVYYLREACEINGKLALAWLASEYGPVYFGYPQQEL